MDINDKRFTEKDRQAIIRAKNSDCSEIDEDWAETAWGRGALHRIAVDKYHREEYTSGLL